MTEVPPGTDVGPTLVGTAASDWALPQALSPKRLPIRGWVLSQPTNQAGTTVCSSTTILRTFAAHFIIMIINHFEHRLP